MTCALIGYQIQWITMTQQKNNHMRKFEDCCKPIESKDADCFSICVRYCDRDNTITQVDKESKCRVKTTRLEELLCEVLDSLGADSSVGEGKSIDDLKEMIVAHVRWLEEQAYKKGERVRLERWCGGLNEF